MAVLSKNVTVTMLVSSPLHESLGMLKSPLSHRNSILNILQTKTRPYFLHSGSSQQVRSHSFRFPVTSQIYWLHSIISPVKVQITRNTIDDLPDFLQQFKSYLSM